MDRRTRDLGLEIQESRPGSADMDRREGNRRPDQARSRIDEMRSCIPTFFVCRNRPVLALQLERVCGVVCWLDRSIVLA